MNNLINKRYKAWVAVFACSFLLFSCSAPSIEEQVEELVESKDVSDRLSIANALADSLSPKAVELLVGLKSNYHASEALDNMLARYPLIAKDKASREKAVRCIGIMQTEKAANYLGEQAMVSDEKNLAFGYLKLLPQDLKKIALKSGLMIDNSAMQDSLIAEYFNLGLGEVSGLLNRPDEVSKKCLQKIITINIVKQEIPQELKLKSIATGLRVSDDENFRNNLLSISRSFGVAGLKNLIDEWTLNKESQQILSAIHVYGNEALLYLSNKLGDDKNAEELLARLGKPAVGVLMGQMRSANQKVRFAAADALVMMVRFNPDAVSNLTQAFDNGSLGAIANNYPFYIRLGQPGTENLLLNALSAYFNREMCLDYLNCGNQAIEGGSKKIAESRGYNIFSREGHHDGPIWGSGN
jgi:hypothetical protein